MGKSRGSPATVTSLYRLTSGPHSGNVLGAWPVAGQGRHHRARGRCRRDRHGRGRRDFDVGSPLLPRLGPHVVHDRLDDRMLRLGRLVVSAGDLDPLQERPDDAVLEPPAGPSQ